MMVLRGNDTVSLALINEKEKPKRKGGHATVRLILAPTFRAESL